MAFRISATAAAAAVHGMLPEAERLAKPGDHRKSMAVAERRNDRCCGLFGWRTHGVVPGKAHESDEKKAAVSFRDHSRYRIFASRSRRKMASTVAERVPMASIVSVRDSSAAGSSSVCNWLSSNEAGMYS